jgi:hypothetical protein
MSKENPVDQTHLLLAALSSSFANALEKHNPGFKDDFLKEIESKYNEIRDMEVSHIEAMQTLTWTKEFLRKQ